MTDPRILSLAAVLGLVFLVRIVVLARYPAPPSEDLAGDLLVLRSYLGDSPRPEFRYHAPPVYYLAVLLPLLQLFPTLEALKISVALGATLIGVPFYFLARRLTSSHVAALLSAGLFSFSGAFNEMLGWGGALNLWGIFFSLWALLLFLRESDRMAWSWARLVLAGFLLSLAIGTHPLSAVFTVLSLLFLVLLGLIFGERKPTLLSKAAATVAVATALSVPYAQVYWFLLANQVNTGPGIGGYSYIAGWLTAPFVTARTEFAAVTLLAAIGMGIFYFGRSPWQSSKSLLASTVAASASLSPFLNPLTIDRAYYFLVIPIFLLVGMFAAGFLRQRPIAAPPRTGSDKAPRPLKPSDRVQTLPALTTLAGVVAILSVSSYGHLVVAVDYYMTLDEDSIAALKWIGSSTPDGAILYTEYARFGTWIEGYAGRKSFQPKPSLYIVTANDLSDVQVANVLHAGNLVLENRYVVLGEFAPAGRYNPVLYQRTPGFFVPSLASSDDYNRVNFTDSANVSTEVAFTSAVRKSVQRSWSNATEAGYELTYEWAFGNLTKAVRVGSDDWSELFLSLEVPNASRLSVEFSFHVEGLGTLVESRAEPKGVAFKVADVSTETRDLEISVTDYVGESLRLNVEPANLSTVLPSIRLKLETIGDHAQMVVRIRSSHGVDVATNPAFADFATVLRTIGASHIVVDKRDFIQYTRFSALIAMYPPVYENDRVLILEAR